MNSKQMYIFITVILLINLSACNLPVSMVSPKVTEPAIQTQVDISIALAETLTAMATVPQLVDTLPPTEFFTETIPPTLANTPIPPTFTPTTPPSPTASNTKNPTSGLHIIPVVTFSLVKTLVPIISTHLDYTANPKYGSANLSAGFSPDPYSAKMTVGGTVNVSYLGSSCSGFASAAPSLRINYGGGGASLMRIYFIGSSGDTTMVVNDPYGNFYCVDDSFGTLNPTIDFNNPAGGTYDIWIGGQTTGATLNGTLYITGASGNHP